MEITLEITNYCKEECNYCSSNASKLGWEMLTAGKVYHYLKSLDSPIDRINISGGEPLTHPEFYKILSICNGWCKDVRVYTNAIKHIVYNAGVLEGIKIDANIPMFPGKITIPDNVDCVHFLRPVIQGRAKNLKRIPKMKVSGSDCKACNHSLLQANGKIVEAPL